MSERTLAGGCQCGAVRYSVRGEPLFAAICHCTMCRRASAAPVVAWAMYRDEAFSLTASQPSEYRSSPEARRSFCGRCGTQLAFGADYLPGLIDITIGSLDDPNAITPTLHYWYAEHLAWVRFADGLPTHAGFPPQGDAPETG